MQLTNFGKGISSNKVKVQTVEYFMRLRNIKWLGAIYKQNNLSYYSRIERVMNNNQYHTDAAIWIEAAYVCI